MKWTTDNIPSQKNTVAIVTGANSGIGFETAYGQSKLANLLFTFELNKRFKAENIDAVATSAHPGWTVTGLLKGKFLQFASRILGQSPSMGALPTLYAAIDAPANAFIGPDGVFEMHGYPKVVTPSPAALDAQVASKLWGVSAQLTGLQYL